MRVIVLHNTDFSGPEPRLYSQDKFIIQSLKSLDYGVANYFYAPEILDHLEEADLVFNLCDSFPDGKEEFLFVKSLEEKGWPFTGCSSETIFTCLNKYRLKLFLEKNNIKVAKAQLFVSTEQPLNLNFPLILKPAQSNASMGIEEDSVVFDLVSFQKKLSLMLKEYGEVLAEEYIEGREFCVIMLGNQPELLPILEIDYNHEYFIDKPKILSYKAKWSKNSNAFKHTYSVLAASLTDLERKNLQETAFQAFKALKCSGYASVDLRMNLQGEVYVLEINPNAYLAPESDLAKAAWAAGLSYEEILNKITGLALERFGKVPLAVMEKVG